MPVDPQYIIKVQGQDYIKIAGLLDLAHQMGIQRVSTEVRQIPTPENGNYAVVHALVVMPDDRTFSATGDSSPASVSKQMVPHLLRHAETRAIARALRWATNSAVTAFEELGGDEEPKRAEPLNRSNGNLATQEQLDHMFELAREEWGEEWRKKLSESLIKRFKTNDPSSLHSGNAERVITGLQKVLAEKGT